MSREELPMKGSQACEPVSLTLTDLRVRTQHNLLMTEAANPTRPATFDDLIQVLEGMGAKRMKSLYVDRDCNISAVYVPEPGTYLVLRLES